MAEFCCDPCPHAVTCADKLEAVFARPEDVARCPGCGYSECPNKRLECGGEWREADV